MNDPFKFISGAYCHRFRNNPSMNPNFNSFRNNLNFHKLYSFNKNPKIFKFWAQFNKLADFQIKIIFLPFTKFIQSVHIKTIALVYAIYINFISIYASTSFAYYVKPLQSWIFSLNTDLVCITFYNFINVHLKAVTCNLIRVSF